MSHESRDLPTDDERARPDESFLQRFHRRKTEARLAEAALPEEDAASYAPVETPDKPEPEPELTDADMPPLESLTAESDYRGFLSARVSEPLRRAALRKLFHGEQFNVIDELDDYAEDFTSFAALGDMVTADMRHQIEVEAEKQAQALRRALLDGDRTEGEVHDTPEALVDQVPAAGQQDAAQAEATGEREAIAPNRPHDPPGEA